MWASKRGNKEMVIYLLEKGANLDVESKDGFKI